MPIRHGGGGLRLRVGVADAAFFGAGCAVLPTMVDRLVGGLTVAGFMTQLEPELGQGSFDEGASGQFAGLEAAAGSGCPTAVEMLAAWDSMVAAVAEEEDHEGLLAKPFADAGVGDGGVRVPKMQHRLTAELDKVAFAAYKAELADLAIDGFPYCAAEAARDQAARAWLTTLPVRGARPPGERRRLTRPRPPSLARSLALACVNKRPMCKIREGAPSV